MKKGMLVKLTQTAIRERAEIIRKTTHEEVVVWRNSPHSKGMTVDGESKLPPQIECNSYIQSDTFTIVRARCAPLLGYYVRKGHTQIMNNRTNEIGYIKRSYIEKVSDENES
jgi:hypothetical protein